MTHASEVADTLAGTFRAAGLSGRRSRWTVRFDEVAWIVQLDVAPRLGDCSLEIGLWFPPTALAIPSGANNCPVVLYPENLPPLGIDRSLFLRSMAAGGGELAAEERDAVLREVAAAVARYVMSLDTQAAVADAYQRGEFRSAFIHKDVRRRVFADL